MAKVNSKGDIVQPCLVSLWTDITPTRVIEDRVLDGAVLKVRAGRPDVLKVTVLKQGIFKLHRLDLYIHEP
jgi:hypothetical protein